MTGPPHDEDVRWVLGTAFGAEPPLGLDRAEILRAGRRKVRNRRILTSGGVAASVIAVVAGAAVLPNLFGESADEVASSTSAPAVTGAPPTTAPAGPSLPLTTITTTLPPVAVHADALTATIAGSVVLSQFQMTPVVKGSPYPLAFVFDEGRYRAAADLADDNGTGYLEIEINYASDSSPDLVVCEPSSDQVRVECRVDRSTGYSVSLSTRIAKSGMIQYVAHGIRRGTEIVVTSSNVASTNPLGRPTTRKAPPLDLDVLHKLVTNPGLTYR